MRRSAKLRKCRLDIPEDAHQGGAIASQTTLCRNLGEKEGEAYFRRGCISGTLRYTCTNLCPTCRCKTLTFLQGPGESRACLFGGRCEE